jgi:hypothetical protein
MVILRLELMPAPPDPGVRVLIGASDPFCVSESTSGVMSNRELHFDHNRPGKCLSCGFRTLWGESLV